MHKAYGTRVKKPMEKTNRCNKNLLTVPGPSLSRQTKNFGKECREPKKTRIGERTNIALNRDEKCAHHSGGSTIVETEAIDHNPYLATKPLRPKPDTPDDA